MIRERNYWIIVIGLLFMMGSHAQTGNSYYISSSLGNDENTGNEEAPFASLEKISSTELQPDDSVFFMRGDQFDGHFIVNGSGSEDARIVITAYGEGEKPVITGQVGEAGGGDYQEAVYVLNNDNIVFDGLEIQNERKHSRTGIDDVDAYGIYIHNTGSEVMKNFVFRNMTFRNVYAVTEMNDPEDFNKLEVAGLRLESAKNIEHGIEKNIQNVLVEDCYFTDIQRLGVHSKHLGASAGIGNDSINRNANLIFRNNEFHYLGGTNILPSRTYNCLIENNLFNHPGASTDPRMPGRGSSVWTWRSHNTVIQHNQCLYANGYLDSHGIHIDHECVNTFVQYNFMKHCEGGFVEILGGNLNAVYRFNISVNDGWRNNPNWINSNHTIWLNNKVGDNIHYSDSSYIYNNTVYIDSAFYTSIDIKAKNTYIYNNIFVALNGSYIGGKQVVLDPIGEEMFISHNLYMGMVAQAFKDEDQHKVYGNPGFLNAPSHEPVGFDINSESFAIDAGLTKTGPVFPQAGKGVFAEIPAYPEVDYFGNQIDLVNGNPNIGASNSKAGTTGLTKFNDSDYLYQGCFVFPNPTSNTLSLELQTDKQENLSVQIFDSLGKVVQIFPDLKTNEQKQYIFEFEPNLENGIYFLVADLGKEKLSCRFILDRNQTTLFY